MRKDHLTPANPARDRLRSDALWITAIGLLYFLVARFSLFLIFQPVGIAAIWPPSGIFLSAILLTRKNVRPYLIGALFIMDLVAEILAGTPLVVSLVYAAALAADATLSAWLLLHFVGEPISFRNVKEIVRFLFLSVLLSNALASVIAASAATLYHGGSFWSSWFWWWSSDGVGNLLVTPLIMSWAFSAKTVFKEFKSQAIEYGVLVFLMVLLNNYAFSHFKAEPWLTLLLNLFTFSFLIWASLRFGIIGAVTTSLVLAGLVLWNTIREHFTFFGADTILTTAILVQIYIAVASIPSMLLAALFAERKRAEETLSASEERLKKAQRMAQLGNWDLDLQTNTLTWSDEIYRIFGIPAQAFSATYEAFLNAIHPEDRQMVDAVYTQSLKNKTPYEITHRLLMSDGAIKFVFERYETTYDDDGRPLRSSGMVQDITERKRAEEALRESEAKNRAILNALPDMMFQMSGDGKILSLKPGKDMRMVMPPDVALGKNAHELAQDESQPRELIEQGIAAMQRALQTGMMQVYESQYGVGNNKRYYETRLTLSGKGQVLGIVRDITERRRTEQEIKKLNQDLERRAGELAALNKTGQVMASSLDLDVVLRLVMDVTTRLLDAEAASVLLQEGEELVFAASAGPGTEELAGTRMPVTSGIAGWVIREEKAVLIGDARSDPRFYNRIDAATGLTTRSLAAAPLVVKGVPRGVVEAINKAQGAFDEHDLMLLEGIAGSAGIAIENARLFAAVENELIERERAEAQVRKLNQDLERRARELAALNKTGQMIASTLDQDAVLSIVMTEIRDSLSAESALVLLQEGDALVLAAVAGANPKELVGMRFPVTSGIAGWVMQEGKAALVGDPPGDPRFWDRMDAVTGLTARSLLAAPLIVKGAPKGVIQVINKAQNAFDEHDLTLLESIASTAAIAIENARLYNAEQKQFRRLQQSQAQLIHAEKMAALGRLAASVAHEINNPLQAVQGCLALIGDDLADSDLDENQRREHTQHDLAVAQVEINRIAAIVRRLRDFYRPAREGLRSTPLHTVLENLVALLGKQLQNSGISVELSWGQLPDLYTNPDLLQQVFLNLAINAIDAMPGGGTLRVRTALEQLPLLNRPQPAPVARVEFSDTGAGIPPELLSRVFEPFFTTKEHGSGLGLSISYEIIESLGGEIAVTSRVGVGTTFVVLLPVREAPNERINNNDRHNTGILSHPGR